MAIPKRAANKQRFNLRKESVYGTAPAVIDTRLNGLRVIPHKDGSTDMFMPSGASLGTLATRFDDFTTLDVSGRLTFQDPMWLWASILGEPLTTQPGTLAYQHIFRWNGFDIVEPLSYGLVYGDANSAVLIPGVIFNSMGFTAGRGAVTEITAGGFGKKQQKDAVIYPRQSSFALTVANATGGDYILTFEAEATDAIAYNANAAAILAALVANTNVDAGDLAISGTGPWTITATRTGQYAATDLTMTINDAGLTGVGSEAGTVTETYAGGAVTSIPATPISPLVFDVWADSSDTGADWSDLGSTQMLGCLEFEMGMGDRHVRFQPMKSDQSADGIAEGESQSHTVRMKLLYDGVAEAMFDNLDRGDMLFVRLQAAGAANQIESGHTYLYQQDQAVLIESVGAPESFGGGVMAIDISGVLAAASADDEALTVTMKNEVAAIL